MSKHYLTKGEKYQHCYEFLKQLSALLGDEYELVASPYNTFSYCLIPVGTKKELSYRGKPAKSFRLADTWNWYANVKKNPDPEYIQCENVSLPMPNDRVAEGKASKPIRTWQVAYYGEDGKYHHVYGTKYCHSTRRWKWDDHTTPERAIAYFLQKEV